MELSYPVGGNASLCSHCKKYSGKKMYENIWRVLRKLKIELPYGSAIPLLEINLDKAIVQKDICTPVFIQDCSQ